MPPIHVIKVANIGETSIQLVRGIEEVDGSEELFARNQFFNEFFKVIASTPTNTDWLTFRREHQALDDFRQRVRDAHNQQSLSDPAT